MISYAEFEAAMKTVLTKHTVAEQTKPEEAKAKVEEKKEIAKPAEKEKKEVAKPTLPKETVVEQKVVSPEVKAEVVKPLVEA